MEEWLAYLFNLASLFVGFAVYFYAPSWGVRGVPGPPAAPLVGNLPLLARHGPEAFRTLANVYGPIFRFHMGRQPIIIVADADLCKEVGIKMFKSIPNRSLPSPISASPIHRKGLFFSRGSRWSTMRNTIICLYQPSHLASLIPTMYSYAEAAALQLSPDDRQGNYSEEVFSDFSLKLATDIIGEAAFGVDFGLSKNAAVGVEPSTGSSADAYLDDVSTFVKEHVYSTTSLKMDLSGSFSIILGLLVPFLQEPFRQLLRRIPATTDWKIDRTNRKLSERLDKIVTRRECTAAKKDNNGGSGGRRPKDFLSAILSSMESGGASKEIFTHDAISALAYEHLLAGSATTSFTLSSVVYLVSGHPEVEKKVLQEIDGFGPPDLLPTADDLQNKFPYLDQVIKESMRYYTVSPLIARETLEQVEVGGFTLPKGTWMWLAPGVLAKDRKHFPEPHLFRPERFDPTGEEEKRRHPCAHIPFGLGPRACIGQKFALQEIKLTLIHLYRNYVFKHSSKMEAPLEFQYGIVLNFKHGVKLRVLKRPKPYNVTRE